ncbi:MAG: family 78 glycoside hydrolase catalytic domain [Bacteroidales bacterium]|nr:family 78 glycoside hydrolase catalytic domain [Bacteroidales bacterium]
MNTILFRISLIAVLATLIGIQTSCQHSGEFYAENLRCEYLTEPLAVDNAQPRLSWEIISQTPDFKQFAYEIIVGADESAVMKGSGNAWESGMVKSSETNQIIYNGLDLKPNTSYYWKVRLWSNKNEPGLWSDSEMFHTGLNSQTWRANWIGMPKNQADKNDYSIPPSPMMRKVFMLEKPVQKAIFFASAKGVYEVWMNGEKIGNQVLAPGWTDYEQLIQYQVYSIGDLKQGDENCISVIVSDGWYAGRLGTIDFGFKDFPWRGWYGRDLRFIGQLEVWYEDGTTETILSDDSWRYYPDGPFREADTFIGVTYDFNYELEGWQNAEFDDSAWMPVTVDKPDYSILKAQIDQAVEVIRELTPVKVDEPEEGIFILDMGQNMVGWLQIEIQGQPGDTITLKHGEMLKEDGFIYRENLRNAPQIETYILKDDKTHVIEPLFTFHGFRFVQIEGLNKAPELEQVVGKVIASATPETGTFSCSNPMLNKLWENIRWTQWGNQVSVPTDCPQRSERMGWMGDAQVFAQTGIFNHDMSAFYTKWGIDIMHAQFETGEFSDVSPRGMPWEPRFLNSPAWADAGLIVPFRIYENYGDIRIIENHYASMKKYIDLIYRLNPDLIYLKGTGHAYNDWLNGNTIISDDYPTTGGEIPRPVFNTAFFIRSTRLLAEAAKITGRDDDYTYYSDLANRTLLKFQNEFLEEDGTILGETQAGYAIALSFDLVPEELRMEVAHKLVQALQAYDNRMSTGFISTICMMDELSEMGYHELACQLAESTRMPSWGYSIEQGATTIWERWDAYVKGRGFQNAGMNSFNHYTFGSIGEWMYKHVLGIQPDSESPGWRHFILAPKIGGSLTSASGSYHSINGLITMEWYLQNNILDLNFEIPPNTSATFIMPQGFLTEVIIDGKRLISISPDRRLEMLSGKHTVHMVSK